MIQLSAGLCVLYLISLWLMKKIDYILSYLYPVTVEVTGSRYNPVLEIVFYAGKYALNSENTNYSFGTLHTLFNRIFRKLSLNWSAVNNILILGFGTGSIASIIVSYKPDCLIDGVEIDEKVIELGKKYFNTGSLNNVTIHCSAADKYIEDCHKKYDLILIDVYVDMIVPPELETEEFLMKIKNTLNPGGMIIFNKAVYSKTISDQIPALKALYEKTFKSLEIMTVMNSGKIFVVKI